MTAQSPRPISHNVGNHPLSESGTYLDVDHQHFLSAQTDKFVRASRSLPTPRCSRRSAARRALFTVVAVPSAGGYRPTGPRCSADTDGLDPQVDLWVLWGPVGSACPLPASAVLKSHSKSQRRAASGDEGRRSSAPAWTGRCHVDPGAPAVCVTMNRCQLGYRPSGLPASLRCARIILAVLPRQSCSGPATCPP